MEKEYLNTNFDVYIFKTKRGNKWIVRIHTETMLNFDSKPMSRRKAKQTMMTLLNDDGVSVMSVD